MLLCSYRSHWKYAGHLIIGNRIILQRSYVSNNKRLHCPALPHLFLPLLFPGTLFPMGIIRAKSLGDWDRRCPLRTLEGTGFLWQLPLSSGLSCPHMGWTKQDHEGASKCIKPQHQQLTCLLETLHADSRPQHLWPQEAPHDESPSRLCSPNRHGNRCASCSAPSFGEPWLTKTMAGIWRIHSLWPFQTLAMNCKWWKN